MDNQIRVSDTIPDESKSHLWSMDILHAKMISKFIQDSNIRNIVEVGCAYGVSTSYIIDAMGNKGHLTLIDIEFTKEVKTLLSRLQTKECDIFVECNQCKSTQKESDKYVLTKNINSETIVILDGDHSLEVVAEEVEILLNHKIRPSAIILHDSGSIDGLEGPKYAEIKLQHNGYMIVKDEKKRPNMRTSRGLSICVRPDYLIRAKSAIRI